MATQRQYEEAIEHLEGKLREQNNFIEGLTKAAHQVAQVVAVDAKHVYLAFGGALMTAERPGFKLEGGESVRVVTQTMQIVDVVDAPELGSVVRVGKVLDDRLCEIGGGPEGSRLALLGRHKPEEGDRVLLDRSGSVVVRVLPAEKTAPRAQAKAVTWDDVGGCEEAKRELIDAIETPYRHRDLYARYSQRATKGVLLHGPSGVGKTLLGRAVASSIAATHGGKGAETGFVYVKGPELLSKWVGASEGNVRGIFEQARAHRQKHGYPAVVFVDEAEALLASRGSGGNHAGVGYMSGTVVPAFLAEMDGMEDSGAFVLLATNLPRLLDAAVLRDGRIDRKVRIGRPDEKVARDIFALHLRGKPGPLDELAAEGARALFDERRVLCEVETTGGAYALALAQAASGAMIEGIVARATASAIRREIAGAKKAEQGLLPADVLSAVDQVEQEHREQDQRLVIAELVDLESVRAVRRAKKRGQDATAAA